MFVFRIILQNFARIRLPTLASDFFFSPLHDMLHVLGHFLESKDPHNKIAVYFGTLTLLRDAKDFKPIDNEQHSCT